ncbi:GDSL esterase/lipase At5g14450-like [Lotus japonicus]|uniref:GDSL esterase/lipase At5g14450-like n=1 Tax=Lotus japonicus TaxID=34305 RepID=UPI00258E4029|nr:GDSL esterase/lipase At5g14450-like [Lotus japonicus]
MMTKFLFLPFTIVIVAAGVSFTEGSQYPAIFNFGDSNSDTGAISAAFTIVHPPNGQNFLGALSGRYSDGRLIIDFITEELKLPYLDAYLNSVGANYRHGANFATGGSSILKGGYSPFHLAYQISQFIQFKLRTQILFNGTEQHFRSSIPRPEDFSRALYMFDIGQNDLSYGFQYSSEEQLRASLPNILSQFSQAVEQLYSEGARVFWIHNTGPIGCLPLNFLAYGKSKKGNVDANGCVISQNGIAHEFNLQLKNQVLQLRKKLPLAKLIYVDVYKAKYELVSNARKLGFVNPLEFCCGNYLGGYKISCGQNTTESGTVSDKTCKNPSEFLSWDGVHYSEEANLLIAKQILSGAFSDPPVTIRQACF